MAAPKKDDATPQGLSWGEEDQETKVSPVRARAADDVKGLFASTQLGAGVAPAVDGSAFFPKTPVGAKSPLDRAQAGSAALPMPPPPATNPDLSTISSLFGGQPVPAPPISGNEYSEAELSWQHARQKRDLLNDRLSSTPEAAPAPVEKKATLMGSFGLDAPKPMAAAPTTPTAPFAATVLAAPKPAPVAPPAARAAAPAAPLPPTPAAAPVPTGRGSQPQPKRRKGEAPPPPPHVGKASSMRAATMVLAGATLLLILALTGGYAGLYPLTPAMEAVLTDAGLRQQPPVASAPRTVKAKPATPIAQAPKAAPETTPPSAAKPVVAETPEPAAAAVAPTPTLPRQSGVAGASADDARRKLATGDVAGAEAMARALLAADAKDHHAMEVFARVLLAQGKAQEALGYIQQIVKKRAKRAAYRVLEGDARIRLADPAGAKAAWTAALELEPGNQDAKRRLSGR
jgi:hypothetical protein